MSAFGSDEGSILSTEILCGCIVAIHPCATICLGVVVAQVQFNKVLDPSRRASALNGRYPFSDLPEINLQQCWQGFRRELEIPYRDSLPKLPLGRVLRGSSLIGFPLRQERHRRSD